jgi:hypothetical protein
VAKILHNGDWYEQLATESLYEEEYERLILGNAAELFPNYRLVPFKMLVESEIGDAKADFALIHSKYREWWVVEAEMSHHSFNGHVRPQVEILSRATYSEAVAEYLCKGCDVLDSEKMCSVVKGQQPRVLVVVNAPVPDWAKELKTFGALLTVFEVFRSRHNRHLYRLNGEHPTSEITDVLSDCRVELNRFLRVLSPGILPVHHGEHMEIAFGNGMTIWTRTDLQDRVYLSSPKPVSLNMKAIYELRERDDGRFVLAEKG